MKTMPPKIYFDTNVLRYFADAFGNAPLDAELKQHLVASPISVLELLSQIGTNQAGAAFRTVKAFPNIFDADNPIPLLPWGDEVFRVLVFDQAPQPDPLTERLSNAMARAFHADCVEDIREDAAEFRNVLDQAKLRATDDFAVLLNSFRQHGAVADDEHRRIFANGIAHRAGVPREGVNVDHVIDRLSALWAYEYEHVMNSAKEREYDPYGHQNDFLDIEQLVYLSHPDMHLLTSDRGFRRAGQSAQYQKIRLEPVHILRNPTEASRVMRAMLIPIES